MSGASTDTAQEKKLKLAIKEIDRMIVAYDGCTQYRSSKGCDVCSARQGPVLGLKNLRKRLVKK